MLKFQEGTCFTVLCQFQWVRCEILASYMRIVGGQGIPKAKETPSI